MTFNAAGANYSAIFRGEHKTDVPSDVLSSPALLFLYYRIEQILGIKAGSDALKKLNNYIEKSISSSFIEDPASFEIFLSSREKIYDISDILTINETYFFRESSHFDILANILPELIKIGRPLQICCAAVSIGCEAYSIAMLLDHYNKKGLDFDFMIDAFDVSAEAVETAINARYTLNAIRTDGSSWKFILDSYLIPDNSEYIVTQNIRRRVRFFTHNIMRGLDKQYDIIFFRNSLIYFSNKNRICVLNNLADSLFNNGLLFLGISETASVNHPLLLNRNSNDAFYFQKTGFPNFQNEVQIINEEKNLEIKEIKKEYTFARGDVPLNCSDVKRHLEKEEGKRNAQDVINTIDKGDSLSVSSCALTAASLYFLNTQDYKNADKLISCLERRNTDAFTLFLRGEYLFFNSFCEEAQKYYHEASVKNKYFWPAFYRIAGLSAQGNKTRYEYKIKKALECIEQVLKINEDENLNYDCFLGGFSPDYFQRILEKKLT